MDEMHLLFATFNTVSSLPWCYALSHDATHSPTVLCTLLRPVLREPSDLLPAQLPSFMILSAMYSSQQYFQRAIPARLLRRIKRASRPGEED